MNPWVARAVLLGLIGLGGLLLVPPERTQAWKAALACRDKEGREVRLCLEDRMVTVLVVRGPDTMVRTVVLLRRDGTLPTDQCHGLLHTLGRKALEKTESVAQAFSVETGEICAAGYYHGVVEFALSTTTKPLEATCEEEAITGYAATNCHHGLGHALMVHFDYDLPAALSVCEKIITIHWRNCANGAFMENFDPAHGTPTWVRADDPFYPCTVLDPKFAEDCYAYVPTPLLRETHHDFEAALARCSALSDPDAEYCVRGLGNRLGSRAANQGLVFATARDTCLTAANRYPTMCLLHVVSTIVTQDADVARARAFCRIVPLEFSDACYTRVVSVSLRMPTVSAKERGSVCSRVSDTDDQRRCRALVREADNE